MEPMGKPYSRRQHEASTGTEARKKKTYVRRTPEALDQIRETLNHQTQTLNPEALKLCTSWSLLRLRLRPSRQKPRTLNPKPESHKTQTLKP